MQQSTSDTESNAPTKSKLRKWTSEEDDVILRHVESHGTRTWEAVAVVIGRSGKQCRERWCYGLDPTLNRSKWTAEEDTRLLELHASMGNRWAEIARSFPGRTDNDVKNRFRCAKRRLEGRAAHIDDIVRDMQTIPSGGLQAVSAQHVASSGALTTTTSSSSGGTPDLTDHQSVDSMGSASADSFSPSPSAFFSSSLRLANPSGRRDAKRARAEAAPSTASSSSTTTTTTAAKTETVVTADRAATDRVRVPFAVGPRVVPHQQPELRAPATAADLGAVDICEWEDDYRLFIDLPGVDKADIDVKVEAGMCLITASRQFAYAGARAVLHTERRLAAIVRSISLDPNADSANPSAKFENGVLEVRFPKLNSGEGDAPHVPHFEVSRPDNLIA